MLRIITELQFSQIYRSFGLKLALKGKITDAMQQSLLYRNAESLYQSDREQKLFGPRPIISANFGNISTLRSIENLLLYHPLFGKFIDYKLNVSLLFLFSCDIFF